MDKVQFVIGKNNDSGSISHLPGLKFLFFVFLKIYPAKAGATGYVQPPSLPSHNYRTNFIRTLSVQVEPFQPQPALYQYVNSPYIIHTIQVVW